MGCIRNDLSQVYQRLLQAPLQYKTSTMPTLYPDVEKWRHNTADSKLTKPQSFVSPSQVGSIHTCRKD